MHPLVFNDLYHSCIIGRTPPEHVYWTRVFEYFETLSANGNAEVFGKFPANGNKPYLPSNYILETDSHGRELIIELITYQL